jgi:hypothetical protein
MVTQLYEVDAATNAPCEIGGPKAKEVSHE